MSALAIAPAPVVVPLDYTGWTTGIASPSSPNGALADPDQDGVANAFEFVFGSNPLVGNPAPMWLAPQIRSGAQLGIGGDPAKTYLMLQARVRRADAGTTVVGEAGATMAELASAGAVNKAAVAGVPVPDGEFEIVTYYYVVPLEDSATGTGVLRLRATVP